MALIDTDVNKKALACEGFLYSVVSLRIILMQHV